MKRRFFLESPLWSACCRARCPPARRRNLHIRRCSLRGHPQRGGDATGWGSKICRAPSDDPTRWDCGHDPKKYDSPLVFSYRGEVLLVGRRHVSDSGNDELTEGAAWSETETVRIQVEYSGLPKRCALWRIDRHAEGGPRVVHLIDVPGWGDTCFPSILADPQDPRHLYLYNYSSPLDVAENADLGWHDAQERETRIYRTELWLW